MSNPLLSVIIPTYNGARYLAATIESALAQDYANQEIIVINDGSTDNTEQVALAFGEKIRYFQHKNSGLGASRNKGVLLSRGSHLAFLDHDDLWSVSKLSEQMALWQAAKTDPLIFGLVEQFICPTLSDAEQAKMQIQQKILPGLHAGTLLVSKKRFLQAGPFFETKQLGEFLDWYFRARAEKIPEILLNKVVMRRRLHLSNIGRQTALFSKQDYLKVIKNNLSRQREIT